MIDINGRRVEFENARSLIREIQVNEPVTLTVVREGKEANLSSKGDPQHLEAVLLFDWQLFSAPIFLVFLVLLITTQPLDRLLWRTISVTLAGLAVLGLVVMDTLTQRIWPWEAVWQSGPTRHHAPQDGWHYSLTVGALVLGLALSLLGALDVRSAPLRRRSQPNSEKDLASDTANS